MNGQNIFLYLAAAVLMISLREIDYYEILSCPKSIAIQTNRMRINTNLFTLKRKSPYPPTQYKPRLNTTKTKEKGFFSLSLQSEADSHLSL
jgi:hypothetical protein